MKETSVITPLPATLQVEATYGVGGTTRLHTALSLTLNRTGANGTRVPQLALGFESRRLLLPLFGGMLTGGDGALMLYGRAEL